jgi:ABC-2 type transport system permease protein
MIFRKFIATMKKDLLLLWRDRAGLLVLFLMPAVLVVIITLVQDNVHKLMGETSARVILVDQDKDVLGERIAERMTRLELVREIGGRPVEAGEAAELVARGDYQACIIIRPETTRRLTARLADEVQASLSGGKALGETLPELELLFDPTVMGGFRAAMQNSLAMVVMEFEVGERVKALSRQLPGFIEGEMKKEAGDYADFISVPPLDFVMSTEPALVIHQGAASKKGLTVVPSPVQHNVPAWALFGVFFIVVPMAGALIRERQEETLARLISMPVPYPVILAGKIAAFVLVCFAQFSLILLIGRFILPLLGVDAFRPGDEWLAVFVVAIAVSLAATGYGIMLGTICRTYEQASMFGSISVVAASAIGGVMVPVYAMPDIMQRISVLSPIGWGLEAFLDVFVRGAGLSAVTGELLSLLAFALLSVLIARLFFVRSAGGS